MLLLLLIFLTFKASKHDFCLEMEKDFCHNGAARSHKELESLFECLVQQHEAKLVQLAQRVLKSASLSRDIIQNVFLKAWEHRATINEVHNVEAWLQRIAKNELIDFLRKTAADHRLRVTLWNTMQCFAPQTEELLDAKESYAIIHSAVSQLPPQRKIVYKLSRDIGLSYKEIAEQLSISRHTVKNQLSLALQSIHRFLSGSMGLLFILFLTR